jgi:arsenate reductase-like glutaredoxin family protein
MKKLLLTFILTGLSLISCSKQKKSTENLVVEGKIKGLRLGTLLLKKLENDSIKSIDSIKVEGDENFKIITTLDEPQEIMLELPEIEDGKILFFAAPGDTVKIYTFLETFGINPVIEGGINQEKLNEYNDMMAKFNAKELDLFQERFEVAKAKNKMKADSLEKVTQNLLKKKQLYKLNFIFTNKELPVSAYLAYTNFYNNKKALDTIYKVLGDSIKKLKYAKEINHIINQ